MGNSLQHVEEAASITNEFSKYFKEELIKDKDHQQTLKIMIEHYEKKEEYEKCDILMKLKELVIMSGD